MVLVDFIKHFDTGNSFPITLDYLLLSLVEQINTPSSASLQEPLKESIATQPMGVLLQKVPKYLLVLVSRFSLQVDITKLTNGNVLPLLPLYIIVASWLLSAEGLLPSSKIGRSKGNF